MILQECGCSRGRIEELLFHFSFQESWSHSKECLNVLSVEQVDRACRNQGTCSLDEQQTSKHASQRRRSRGRRRTHREEKGVPIDSFAPTEVQVERSKQSRQMAAKVGRVWTLHTEDDNTLDWQDQESVAARALRHGHPGSSDWTGRAWRGVWGSQTAISILTHHLELVNLALRPISRDEANGLL
mmetsp:Transcript_16204/g.22621  ORF Transcript_16204/g.22621 Transcript_16204/m.22621 type:complete len:185 (+) Transcript_16204:414-968(+)